MEETTIIIPYIRYKTPPKDLNTPSMLLETRKKLDVWVNSLTPKISCYDAIHMKKIEKNKDGLHLTYSIIRNKLKPKKEGKEE